MTASAPREAFDPIDTSFDPTKHSVRDEVDTVESPSLSSSNALARFEFEPGRSKEGTKVLMVEWEEDDVSKTITGDWELSWPGKKTVLPARENAGQHSTDEMPINRLYFLLGAGVAVPTQVVLKKGSVVWKTNPLPAIFSPELGATATAAGKKGVLHTIWAKKRLQVLQREIEQEEENNVEGIGLEMAQAEKEWIEQNFGVATKSPTAAASTAGSGGGLNSPTSPRSPGGGRLMDKLRGLRIDIRDGAPGSSGAGGGGGGGGPQLQTRGSYPSHNPLSPESSDVAVGSFGSFAALKGEHPSTLAAKPPQPPQQQQQQSTQAAPRMAPVRPPDSFAAQQRQSAAGMGSLNAFASSTASTGFAPTAPPSSASQAVAGAASSASAEEEDKDDLFALPMSPRSPEMTKSPFSLLKG